MSEDKRLVAIAAADLHLSHIPPPFRSVEADWMETQRGYLRQLRNLTKTSVKNPLYFTGGNDPDDWIGLTVPTIIAGDIFNKHNATHETVNLAIRELPGTAAYDRVYSVCGNHDAPNHRVEEIHRSAYGVLKESRRVVDLGPRKPVVVEGKVPMRLHGFPCGYPVQPLKDPHDLYLEIAVVHDYIWHSQSTGYDGAPEEKRLKACKKNLVGYDVAIYGDNHVGFVAEVGGCTVCNCGGFMIRKSDERDYQPCVGLIYSDGSVERVPLDTSQDKYLDKEELVKILESGDASGFIEELMELGDRVLDFAAYLRRVAESDGISPRVKDLILSSLDKGETK